MIGKSVMCVVEGVHRAEQLLERLRVAGFSKNYISLLFVRFQSSEDHFGNTVFDWLGPLKPVPIPQNGTLILGGTVSTTTLPLNAPAILPDALKALGLQEPHTKDYVQAVLTGAVLLSVIVSDPDGLSSARWIFEDSRAQKVFVTRESRLLEPNPEAAKLEIRPKKERRKRFGRLFTS